MDLPTTPCQVPHPRDIDEPAGPASCPHCGGRLVPLRGLLRCSFCYFVVCQDCEGGQGEG
jgi:hypothetical protein